MHAGYDYYLFLGVPHAPGRARLLVTESGLFLEEFVSPYHRETGDEDGDDS